MISNLLNKAKEQASSRNNETVLLAFEKYNNSSCCLYKRHAEEFSILLNRYIIYKIKLHQLNKDDSIYAEKSRLYYFDTAKKIHKRLTEIKPCPRCVEKFNPTNKWRSTRKKGIFEKEFMWKI